MFSVDEKGPDKNSNAPFLLLKRETSIKGWELLRTLGESEKHNLQYILTCTLTFALRVTLHKGNIKRKTGDACKYEAITDKPSILSVQCFPPSFLIFIPRAEHYIKFRIFLFRPLAYKYVFIEIFTVRINLHVTWVMKI